MEPFIFLLIVLSTVTKSAQFENLAFGKTVTVSKRYNNRNFDPSLAVDGDVSTDLLKCSLTASGEREAWLTVDLGKVKNIASISFLHGGLGLKATFMDPSQSGIYPALSGNGTVQFVNKNTTICPYRFKEENAKVVCLNWGYLPDNPLWYKVDTSLPYEHREYRCRGYEAALKDCSNRYTTCRYHYRKQIGISCKSGDTLSGFSVYVSDTPDWKSGSLCYQHEINEPVDNNVSIDCFTTGRYVTIYNSRNDSLHSTLSSFAYINICEVNVTGCDIGHYGDKCLECPSHCTNNTCQMQDGHCTSGCFSTWFGPLCQDCAPNYYGDYCNISCSNHCRNKLCDQTTGHCFSCIPNRFGVFCENQAIIDNVAGKESIASTFDSNSNAGFIATTVIMVILLIGIIVYIVKKKWHSNSTQSSRENSTQSSRENYEIQILHKQTNEYEEIRNKNTNGECDKASEYSEIA